MKIIQSYLLCYCAIFIHFLFFTQQQFYGIQKAILCRMMQFRPTFFVHCIDASVFTYQTFGDIIKVCKKSKPTIFEQFST